MSDERTAEDIIAENPELATALEAILDVDEQQDGWEFDDVPVDSGQFGKLVDRGVVESSGDAYRLADPDAVRTALGTRSEDDSTDGEDGRDQSASGSPLRSSIVPIAERIDVRAGNRYFLGAVGIIVTLFVVTRAHIYRDVFRGGDVVLTVNDPYYYRYLIEQLLAMSNGPFDVTVLWRLPETVSDGEPLFVVVMWAFTSLLGGDAYAAGLVLAWYPVVVAAIMGVLVYLLGSRVLGDRRVGFFAAVVLAISPAHATRTALGFGDHHPFDYLWLTATVTVFAWLVRRDSNGLFAELERRDTVLLGVAIAGQTLAWEASPILLVPLAIYAAAKAPLDVAAERSPLRANAPLLVALAIATFIVAFVSVVAGWLSLPVAASLGALFCGAVLVIGVGELSYRRDWSVSRVVALEGGVALLGLVSLLALVPSFVDLLIRRFGFLFFTSGIGETGSLFSPENLLGLEYFGFFLLLAAPFLFWGTWRAAMGNATWLVLSAYGWYFAVLSALQLRFMGHLAPVLSVFGGVGFVWAVSYLGVWEPPAPLGDGSTDGTDDGLTPGHGGLRTLSASSVRSAVIILVCFVLVASVGLVHLGPKVGSATHNEATYDTATWMGSFADERGWTYPQNYVFSRWSVNRVYNYFVSGNASSYRYAQENYVEFIYDDDPQAWYQRLHNRTGFVVMEALPRRAGTIQPLLYEAYGSRYNGYDGVAHFRAVYATTDENKKVFTLVPGAHIVGSAVANASVQLRTTVRIPHASFTYRRATTTGPNGGYNVTVPYPGKYELTVGNETRTVTVRERAVERGKRVRIGE